MNTIKSAFAVSVGGVGAFLAHFFGMWDKLIEAMIVFMVIDLVSGTAVAMIFKRSPKTPDGRLWSSPLWKGMAKKGMALFFVIIGKEFDLLMETDYVRAAVIWCVIASELVSIIENAALMGVPIPQVLKNMLTVMNHKVVDVITDKAAADVIKVITKEPPVEKGGGDEQPK